MSVETLNYILLAVVCLGFFRFTMKTEGGIKLLIPYLIIMSALWFLVDENLLGLFDKIIFLTILSFMLIGLRGFYKEVVKF